MSLGNFMTGIGRGLEAGLPYMMRLREQGTEQHRWEAEKKRADRMLKLEEQKADLYAQMARGELTLQGFKIRSAEAEHQAMVDLLKLTEPGAGVGGRGVLPPTGPLPLPPAGQGGIGGIGPLPLGAGLPTGGGASPFPLPPRSPAPPGLAGAGALPLGAGFAPSPLPMGAPMGPTSPLPVSAPAMGGPSPMTPTAGPGDELRRAWVRQRIASGQATEEDLMALGMPERQTPLLPGLQRATGLPSIGVSQVPQLGAELAATAPEREVVRLREARRTAGYEQMPDAQKLEWLSLNQPEAAQAFVASRRFPTEQQLDALALEAAKFKLAQDKIMAPLEVKQAQAGLGLTAAETELRKAQAWRERNAPFGGRGGGGGGLGDITKLLPWLKSPTWSQGNTAVKLEGAYWNLFVPAEAKTPLVMWQQEPGEDGIVRGIPVGRMVEKGHRPVEYMTKEELATQRALAENAALALTLQGKELRHHFTGEAMWWEPYVGMGFVPAPRYRAAPKKVTPKRGGKPAPTKGGGATPSLSDIVTGGLQTRNER